MECTAIEDRLKGYKRAINDIRNSLEDIESFDELLYFNDVELKEILNGLDLD